MLMILALGTFAYALTEKTVTIAIDGMHCDKCAASVAKKLKATDGVKDATVTFDSKAAKVTFDDAKVSVEKIQEVINSTGFKAKGEAK
jgi:copper chaperone CopZ